LDKNEDFVGALNPDTKKEIAAVGNANMRFEARKHTSAGEKRLFQM
nr:glutamate--tRNA ligase, cytoplasmic [Tanacetum cinerariifolium]